MSHGSEYLRDALLHFLQLLWCSCCSFLHRTSLPLQQLQLPDLNAPSGSLPLTIEAPATFLFPGQPSALKPPHTFPRQGKRLPRETRPHKARATSKPSFERRLESSTQLQHVAALPATGRISYDRTSCEPTQSKAVKRDTSLLCSALSGSGF